MARRLRRAASLAVVSGLAAAQRTLETVTVTAERHNENIQDVPSSVGTINNETLDVIHTGGQDLRGLPGGCPA